MNDQHPPFIVVFPRGQISEYDKARMSEAGIICVEADTPKEVCQLHLTQPLFSSLLSGDAIVHAAITALAGAGSETSTGQITSAGRAKGEFLRLLALALQPVRDDVKEVPRADQA